MRRLPAPLPPLALALALPLVLALLGTTGCSHGPDAAAADDGVVVEVMIEDGRARPAGDRVDVPTGETVELVVMADSAGLIHVQPGGDDRDDQDDQEDQEDQAREIEYQPGTTTFALEMDRTGTVDVELHDPDQLLVQLEVR